MVREATREDLNNWIEMRTALWPGEDHRSELLAYFDGQLDEPVIVFMLIENRTTAGFVELSIRLDQEERSHGFIEGLFVKPAFRRSGAFIDLIQYALRWSAKAGFESVLADRGLRLYEVQHSGKVVLLEQRISEEELHTLYPLRPSNRHRASFKS
jgi:GNAT superfamily N-acetyltransferase